MAVSILNTIFAYQMYSEATIELDEEAFVKAFNRQEHNAYQTLYHLFYRALVAYALRSENEDFLGSFSIFLDNSPRIEVKGDNLRSLRVTGSPAHAEYERIYDYILDLPGYAESKVAAYYVYDYYSLHPQGHRGSEGQEHRVHHADDGRQAGTLGTRREETKYNLAKSL